MAFDRRGYDDRSVRDGDRVTRVYLGNGPAAQLAAMLAERWRSERRDQSLAWQAREAALAPAEALVRELERLAEALTCATLLAAGYHRHDRGAWRRRRMKGETATDGTCGGGGINRDDGAGKAPSGDPLARRGRPRPTARTSDTGCSPRPRRGRGDPAPGTRHPADGGRDAGDGRPRSARARPARKKEVVPKALRDRMKGMVGSEN